MGAMLISTPFTQSEKCQPALEVKGLNGGPGDLILFKDLDLRLPPGVSALLGDEGSGKTSLLRLLSGDLIPQSGELCVLGVVAPVFPPPKGAVFWADLRLPDGDENTPSQCWEAFAPFWPAWSEAAQHSWCKALQLTPHLDKRLNMLSTGTRRKVGLVAALASGAAVTLLDQPFVSLDQASIRVLEEMLVETYQDSDRACLIADYEKPPHIPLSAVFQL
jgi:ABC-type multidrug transport system ATPase subunit